MYEIDLAFWRSNDLRDLLRLSLLLCPPSPSVLSLQILPLPRFQMTFFSYQLFPISLISIYVSMIRSTTQIAAADASMTSRIVLDLFPPQ